MNKILEKKSCQAVYLEVKREGRTKQNTPQGPEQDGRQVTANEIMQIFGCWKVFLGEKRESTKALRLESF